MKKALIGLLVALMAVSSFAGLVATWSAYGILDGPNGVADAGPWIFSDGTGDSATASSTTSAIWELVYTTSDTIGDITFNEADGTYAYADGDKVLATRTSDGSAAWTIDGTTLTADEFGIIGQGVKYEDLTTTTKSGNLYSAIFQYCGNDVYYALSPIQTDVNWANDGSLPGTDVNFSLSGDTALTKLGTVTTVPEPATMSLLGLGALAMVLRRKLRK